VGFGEIGGGHGRALGVDHAGWPHGSHIRSEDLAHDFIVGDPPAHAGGIAGEALHDVKGIASKERGIVIGLGPASVVEPSRRHEVMEGDDGLHAAGAQGHEHFFVASESGLIEAARTGLDALPGNREPKGIGTQPLRQVEVFFVAVPEVGGFVGVGAVCNGTLLTRPARPIRLERRTLHLEGRVRHAPHKA